jgi:RNA polymerase sigma factor (sigma-70 family)
MKVCRKGIKNEIPYGTLVGVSPEIRSIWYSKHDEPEPCELIDVPITDEDAEQNKIDCKKLVNYLLDTIYSYDFRVRNILFLRYWHDLTYQEIGEIFGVSATRIRQIEASELRRFRHRLKLISCLENPGC